MLSVESMHRIHFQYGTPGHTIKLFKSVSQRVQLAEDWRSDPYEEIGFVMLLSLTSRPCCLSGGKLTHTSPIFQAS